MIERLNHLLADLAVEYHKLQNFHWYIQGKDFFTIHAKLEEYYGMVSEAVDETAEQILMLGGRPLASLKEFLAETSIQEADRAFLSSGQIADELRRDFRLLLEEARTVKRQAEAEENALISAAMDGHIQEFSKLLWMLGQMDRQEA